MRKAKSFFNFRSLKVQLITSSILVIVIILTLTFYINNRIVVNLLQTNNYESAKASMEQVEQNIDSITTGAAKLFNIVLTSAWFNKASQADNCESRVDKIGLFTQFAKGASVILSTYDYVDSVGIITPDKNIFVYGEKSNIFLESFYSSEFPFLNTSIYKNQINARNMSISPLLGMQFYVNYPIMPLASTNNYHPVNYLCFIKNIASEYNASKLTMLIINVKMSSIENSYEAFNGRFGDVYIIDKNNLVISGPDPTQIQTPLRTGFTIPDSGFGNFISGSGQDKKQIIYYNLLNNNWKLIYEIPYGEYSKSVAPFQYILGFVFLVSSLMIIIILAEWITRIMKPIRTLQEKMENMSKGRMGETIKEIPQNEIGILISQFNNMSINIQNLLEDNSKKEAEKRELEIKMLQSQINPHFLYNTLNAIKWMANLAKAENIAKSIALLGNILRPVYKINTIFSCLSDELEYVKIYKEIMDFRYGDIVDLNINVENPELLQCEVLSFMFQPIIENCYEHGFVEDGTKKEIHISCFRLIDKLIIVVTDNGIGIDSDITAKPLEKGFGLYNVNRRIELNYGEKYGIAIKNNQSGGGTCVRIELPYQRNLSELEG